MIQFLRQWRPADYTQFDWVRTASAAMYLTFYFTVLNGLEPWHKACVLFLLGAAMFLPKLAKQSWLWWLVVAHMLWVIHYTGYFFSANHFFVLTYWAMALALGHSKGVEFEKTLAFNGKVILCAAIGLSVVQKALSPHYLNGDYFHFAFHIRHVFRPVFFAHFAEIKTVMDELVNDYMIKTNGWLSLPLFSSQEVVLAAAPGVRLFSLFMAWTVTLIEVAVPLMFLLKRGPEWLRHAFLLAFFAPIVFIVGEPFFASLVAILGLAQVSRGHKKTIATYVIFFVVAQAINLIN